MTDRFTPELKRAHTGDHVTVTGYVQHVRKFTEYYSIRIRDPFDSIIVVFDRKDVESSGSSPARTLPKKGDRIRVEGIISENKQSQRLVRASDAPIILGNSADKLKDLHSAMREQASRMLLAHAIRLAGAYLRDREGFAEFDSRVISTKWADVGLEPLKVVYPGFGCPVPLATSPAAQVIDFINTTGVSRAFTSTTSFSTTYRFPEGGAELRVVVGKATGMGSDRLATLLQGLVRNVLEGLDPEAYNSRHWEADGTHIPGHLNLIHVDLPTTVQAEDGSALPGTVVQIRTESGVPLAEGFRELLGGHAEMAGFTIYPGQFLSLLSATPARNLRDLRRFRVW